MTSNRRVIVKKLPARVTRQPALEFLGELKPSLRDNRPCLVFDFSEVCELDSSGIEMLLRCMEEVMKRNGDLKLAAISPPVALILKITRVDYLFEIFDKSSDAVESFDRFPVEALRQTAADTQFHVHGNRRERL